MAGSLDIYEGASGDDRKPLKPTSNYGWDGTVWVPQLVAPDGSFSFGATFDDFGSLQSVQYTSSGVPAPVGSGGGGGAAADYTGTILIDSSTLTPVLYTPKESDYVDGYATNTDGTSTPVIPAYATGKQYITRAIFSNTHATTTGFACLKSGSTQRTLSFAIPPGGATYNLDILVPNASNEAWSFDPDAAVTTLGCMLIGYKVAD